MNGNFDLKDDDVLAFPKDVLGWKLGTDKVKNALDEIKRIPTMRDGGEFIAHLWEKGVECEYLSVNGGGWRKGKLKMHVKFEFVPEEPIQPPSPLDDLRSNLNT